jgi:peptide deformylase
MLCTAMTIRKIATIGHPVLRQRAREVTKGELASPELQRFVDDLVETMRDANGAGLAAIQVYEPIRICAIEVGENPRYPYKPRIPLTILVNPVLEPLGDETFLNYEGCLSVPNLRGKVRRFAKLRVRAWDREGAPIDRVVQGISAGTFQHEVDHLDGRIFVDRVEDPTSLATWDNFERYGREQFVSEVQEIVARYGE